MKKTENKHLRHQPGTGYLLGSVFTFVSAITVFFLSENIVVALSAGIPVGVTLGIVFEQIIRPQKPLFTPHVRNVITALLIIGLMLLSIILIFQKFI